MRRLVLVGLAFLPLSSCASTSSSPFDEPNALMAEEIRSRVLQIPFQHREELFQNLLWLAQIGEQAIPELLRALDNDDPKVRSSCAWVLGRIGDRRTVEYLQKLSGDEHPVVSLEASRSLLEMGDIQQAPALIEGLDSDRAEVRYMCHEALKSATGREFGYDHLSEDLVARQQAVLEWRTWWADLSGDEFFASTYANENGLNEQPPAAPMGEIKADELDRELDRLLPVTPVNRGGNGNGR